MKIKLLSLILTLILLFSVVVVAEDKAFSLGYDTNTKEFFTQIPGHSGGLPEKQTLPTKEKDAIDLGNDFHLIKGLIYNSGKSVQIKFNPSDFKGDIGAFGKRYTPAFDRISVTPNTLIFFKGKDSIASLPIPRGGIEIKGTLDGFEVIISPKSASEYLTTPRTYDDMGWGSFQNFDPDNLKELESESDKIKDIIYEHRGDKGDILSIKKNKKLSREKIASNENKKEAEFFKKIKRISEAIVTKTRDAVDVVKGMKQESFPVIIEEQESGQIRIIPGSMTKDTRLFLKELDIQTKDATSIRYCKDKDYYIFQLFKGKKQLGESITIGATTVNKALSQYKANQEELNKKNEATKSKIRDKTNTKEDVTSGKEIKTYDRNTGTSFPTEKEPIKKERYTLEDIKKTGKDAYDSMKKWDKAIGEKNRLDYLPWKGNFWKKIENKLTSDGEINLLADKAGKGHYNLAYILSNVDPELLKQYIQSNARGRDKMLWDNLANKIGPRFITSEILKKLATDTDPDVRLKISQIVAESDDFADELKKLDITTKDKGELKQISEEIKEGRWTPPEIEIF